MTRDDIIRMARLAGSIDSEDVIETMYTAFAAAERERLEATAWGASKTWIDAAVAAEREECAKVCESFNSEPVSHATVAAAIRARSEK